WVANGPRGKKELLKLALGAGEHRPDAEPVGQNFSTYASYAIVDGKLVLDAVQCVFENWITKLRKALYVLNFIVIDHGKFAERPITIRFRRIRPVGSSREASL